MPNDPTISTAYPQVGDSDDILEKRRTKGIADIAAAVGAAPTGAATGAQQLVANSLLTAIRDNADQVEPLISALNVAIADQTGVIQSESDAAEALLAEIRTAAIADGVTDAQLIQNLADIETLLTANNVLLTAGNSNTANVSPLLTAIDGKMNATNTLLSAINGDTTQTADRITILQGLVTSLTTVVQTEGDQTQAALLLINTAIGANGVKLDTIEGSLAALVEADLVETNIRNVGGGNSRKGFILQSKQLEGGTPTQVILEATFAVAVGAEVDPGVFTTQAVRTVVKSLTSETAAAVTGNVQTLADTIVGSAVVIVGFRIELIKFDEESVANSVDYATVAASDPLALNKIRRVIANQRLDSAEAIDSNVNISVGQTVAVAANSVDVIIDYLA